MVVHFFNSELASIPEGKPCISGEQQLARHCPNWYHGRIADVASMAVTGLDAMAVHKAMMVHCTGYLGQYSSTDFLDNCAQAIKQVSPNLDKKGVSSVLEAIRGATKAIPALTGDQKLKFEDQHWFYLGRYRPQQAQMAHTLAVDGKEIDFKNQQFLEE
jgi:hypothetical protein